MERTAPSSLKRRLALLLAAIFAVAVLLGLVTARATVERSAAADEVKATLVPAQRQTDELFNSLVDQETGVRGFALTGDERFLTPYDSGRALSETLLHGLRARFSNDPLVLVPLEEVADRSAAWRAAAAEPDIARTRAGTPPTLQSALDGKDRFDEVRRAVDELRAAIDGRLVEAQAELLDADRRQTVALVMFVAATALSIGLVAAALLRLIIRPIEHLRDHVRQVSDDLSHPIPEVGPAELRELACDIEDMRVDLRHAVTKANAMLAAMSEAYAFSVGGRIVEVNDRLCELTGFSREQLIGATTPYPFWAPEDVDALLAASQRVRAGNGGALEAMFVTADGVRFPVSMTVKPAVSGPGEARGWVSTMHDISEFKRREDDLQDMASRDPLTGLYNRRAIDAHLHRLAPGDALVAIDLDHFKEVNDTLGHAAGDDVLRSLSGALTAHLREDDWAGRLGGEEFVIALHGAGSRAVPIVERLRAGWLAIEPPTSFSAGIAVHVGTDTPLATLTRADDALYLAKRLGRNRIEQWRPALGAPVRAPARPRT